MRCHTVADTNLRLHAVIAEVQDLEDWANEDREHARLHDARETAREDSGRAANLRTALAALRRCIRPE